MKALLIWCLLIALVSGCATQRQVAQMEGRGRKQVFPAGYDSTWRAAIDAAQVGGLQVRTADKTSGYIAAHRGMTWSTHGENVGIWIKPLSPTETQVEVVSRQAAPPKFWMKNWEDDVLAAVGANLTREATGPPNIAEPAGVETQRDHIRPRLVPAPPMPPAPPAPAPRNL